MAEFRLIDTSKFLQPSDLASKTSETSLSVPDSKTYVSEPPDRDQQNPGKTYSGNSATVSQEDKTAPQHGSFPAKNVEKGSAGFAAPSVPFEHDGTAEDDLPRLPWQLERLVSAASSDLLPKEPVMLPSGLVPDLNRYALAWAVTYLVGDRQEALSRLWQVRRAWQGETPS